MPPPPTAPPPTPPNPPTPPSRSSFPPVRKSLGQHFLADRQILRRIADAVEPESAPAVIEIGPGRGSLTEHLVGRAPRLVLVEYDRALAQMLTAKYRGDPSVRVVEADVLDVRLGELAGGPFRLIGNVPYYITTPILFHALERPRPDRAVFLVQREVAERVVAGPGSKEYGALSVNIQAVAIPTILFRVAPGSFRPPPKVESAVIRLVPRPDPVIAEADEPSFRRFVQDVFGMRRKQMRRILRAVWQASVDEVDHALEAAGIDPAARPETLTAAQFAGLLPRGKRKQQSAD